MRANDALNLKVGKLEEENQKRSDEKQLLLNTVKKEQKRGDAFEKQLLLTQREMSENQNKRQQRDILQMIKHNFPWRENWDVATVCKLKGFLKQAL